MSGICVRAALSTGGVYDGARTEKAGLSLWGHAGVCVCLCVRACVWVDGCDLVELVRGACARVFCLGGLFLDVYVRDRCSTLGRNWWGGRRVGTHTNTNTHIRTHKHACSHTHALAQTRAHTHTSTQTDSLHPTHSLTHPRTHTHSHTGAAHAWGRGNGGG